MYYDDVLTGMDDAPPNVQPSRRESVASLSPPNSQYIQTFDDYSPPAWALYPPNVQAQQPYYGVDGQLPWDAPQGNSGPMYLMPYGPYPNLPPAPSLAGASPSVLTTPDNIGWDSSTFNEIPMSTNQVYVAPTPMPVVLAGCPSTAAENPYPYHQSAHRYDDDSLRAYSIPERGGSTNHQGNIAEVRVAPGHFAPNVTRTPFPGHTTGIARRVSAAPTERQSGRKPGPSMSQPGVGSAEFVDAETIFQTFERAEKTAKIELYFPVEQRPEVDGKMYKCRLRFKVPESGPICWGAEQAPCNRKFRSMDIWRRHVIEGHLGCRREKAQEGNDLAQGSDPTREKGKDLRRKEVFQRRRARVGPSGSQPLDARRRRAGHDTEQGLDTNVKFHPYKRHSRSG